MNARQSKVLKFLKICNYCEDEVCFWNIIELNNDQLACRDCIEKGKVPYNFLPSYMRIQSFFEKLKQENKLVILIKKEYLK